MSKIAELKEIVHNFPQQPGVYIMRNTKKKVIYVGKAKNLRNRTSSYFIRNKDVKTTSLVKKIDSIEYIITPSEYDALLLENNLIKKYNPRYNIMLKDGKTYPVIRITNEAYPRIFKTRSIVHDGSDYFGPYPQGGLLGIYLDLAQELYPLRYCKGHLKKRENPCLYYHIGKCSAPCVGKISKEDYNKIVSQVKRLLSKNVNQLLKLLQEEMEKASHELQFEKAAHYRDKINQINDIKTNLSVQDFNTSSRDYIACASKEHLITFTVFQMREGKMTGRDLYRTEIHDDLNEAYSQFIVQYYDQELEFTHKPPKQLYIKDFIDIDPLKAFFSKQGYSVQINVPQKGHHVKIIRMAYENALQEVSRRYKSVENIPALEELQQLLQLPKLPKRIEGFDIAQLHGKYPVSSMVSFFKGNPDKKNYRYFSIKSLDGAIDDYESIREAVARRYTRILNEGLEQPDLILIDGGKGQVNAAFDILEALGLKTPIIGLAKEEELIFFPHKSDPLDLPQSSEALKVLQYVRDEAHRFATSFNKRKRSVNISFTQLEALDGIGPKRSSELMTIFKSIDGILSAGPEEISARTKIPIDLAEKLVDYLQESQQ